MAERETLFEFPCPYSVKVMGFTAPDFAELVHRLIAAHVAGLEFSDVSSKPSSQGKYTSVTVTFTAHSKSQLDAIYSSLTCHERVVVAL
jgi:putative lipoic acid-binding regulatory protein